MKNLALPAVLASLAGTINRNQLEDLWNELMIIPYLDEDLDAMQDALDFIKPDQNFYFHKTIKKQKPS